MSTLQMERRAFLKISVAASGGLLIGLYLPGASKLAAAQERSASAFMPNAFLRIGTDERVTVIVNHSEMGFGYIPVWYEKSCRHSGEAILLE